MFNRSCELTNCMQHSPSLAVDRPSRNEEIPRDLWNPLVHYRIHKRSPLVPILRPIIPVQGSSSHSLQVHFNIIITLQCLLCLLSLRSPHQSQYKPLLSPISAKCPAHLILLDLNDIWPEVQIIKFLLV